MTTNRPPIFDNFPFACKWLPTYFYFLLSFTFFLSLKMIWTIDTNSDWYSLATWISFIAREKKIEKENNSLDFWTNTAGIDSSWTITQSASPPWNADCKILMDIKLIAFLFGVLDYRFLNHMNDEPFNNGLSYNSISIRSAWLMCVYIQYAAGFLAKNSILSVSFNIPNEESLQIIINNIRKTMSFLPPFLLSLSPSMLPIAIIKQKQKEEKNK